MLWPCLVIVKYWLFRNRLPKKYFSLEFKDTEKERVLDTLISSIIFFVSILANQKAGFN